MKNKYYNWLIIIVSVTVMIMPFFYKINMNAIVLMITSAMMILSNIIDNKIIKYSIGFVCFLALMFLFFRLQR